MRKLFSASLAAIFALFIIPQNMSPQAMRMAHFAAPVHSASSARHLRSNQNFTAYGPTRRMSPYQSLLYPFGGFSDYSDDPYASGYPVAAEPPVILMQASSRGTEARLDQPQPPSQSLMIELQGDRYVRVAESEATGGLNSDQVSTVNAVTANSAIHAPGKTSASIELTPALLIFRDGHHEEIHDYAIAAGVIYVRGNYYTDGYWNKKIELSTLNLSETMQSNTARGVNFQLPTAPNEVITRP